ncbi:MAG: hypothetical protein QXH30_03045 [Candidatus Bilamarchaeaceae archaeon]
MGDQGEIHIDLQKLGEFVICNDRETRIHALKGIYGIFNANASNGRQMQAKVMVILNARLAEIKGHFLSADAGEQRIFVAILRKMVDVLGADAIDMSAQALEVALETSDLDLRKNAEALVIEYMGNSVNRQAIMRMLVAESTLNLGWENAGTFNKIASAALHYPELREAALMVMANVALHPRVRIAERREALLTIKKLSAAGMDISCIETTLMALSRQRNCPLLEDARGLLQEGSMRGFNKPGKESIFRKLDRAVQAIAFPLARRTGTSV